MKGKGLDKWVQETIGMEKVLAGKVGRRARSKEGMGKSEAKM